MFFVSKDDRIKSVREHTQVKNPFHALLNRITIFGTIQGHELGSARWRMFCNARRRRRRPQLPLEEGFRVKKMVDDVSKSSPFVSFWCYDDINANYRTVHTRVSTNRKFCRNSVSMETFTETSGNFYGSRRRSGEIQVFFLRNTLEDI